MAITFARLKDYLEAIADAGNLDATDSGHGRFWNTDYAAFISGGVPNKHCGGAPVPIISLPDRTASAFFQILQTQWCAATPMPQMPRSGPFVTAQNYSIQLTDGTVVSGAQVIQDIHDWLAAGAPENG